MLKKKENKSVIKSTLLFIGGAAFTAASVITLQPVITKLGNKLYKESLKREKIDFDNLGPEIVKTNNQTDEKDEKIA